jgi:hypothetical protein
VAHRTHSEDTRLEIPPERLGTLELDGLWAPYIDLVDLDFLPTRVTIGNDEYAFESSIIIFGHGAVLPAKVRDLRASGRKPVIIEREDRYYVYVTAASGRP